MQDAAAIDFLAARWEYGMRLPEISAAALTPLHSGACIAIFRRAISNYDVSQNEDGGCFLKRGIPNIQIRSS